MEEGFLPEYGETFWMYDGETYYGRRLANGRNLRRSGKGKGRYKQKFKNRSGFRPRRKGKKGNRSYEIEETVPEEDENTNNEEETSLAVKGKMVEAKKEKETSPKAILNQNLFRREEKKEERSRGKARVLPTLPRMYPTFSS